MRTIAIVPAAGSGKRLKVREKKPFVTLGGKPLIAHALKALESSACIDGIIIAAEARSIERIRGIISRYGFKKVMKVVEGGHTRSGSVRNCFKAIDADCDIVLIHDAARPFPGMETIKNSVILAKRYGACVTAIPSTDTMKLAGRDLFVKSTLDRKTLWRAQTPQAFRYGILNKALGRLKENAAFTDDASMVERLGVKVKILEGAGRNIKVTTKEDLKIAEVLLCG